MGEGKPAEQATATTGLPELDAILGGVRAGDNVVWQVDRIDDYREFVRPFAAAALAAGKRLVYIRFAAHRQIIEPSPGVTVHDLDAFHGFKSFTVQLHTLIAREGRGVCYVFDCLSALLDAWATDEMIGNFFRVACPLCFSLDTVAYFALQRRTHPFATIARIRATTQLLIDLYRTDDGFFLHPLKVWERSSATMFLPHRREDERFVPLATSCEAARLYLEMRRGLADGIASPRDHWEQMFIHAGRLTEPGADPAARQAMTDELCRLIIGREKRLFDLARRFLTIEDFHWMKERLIGTGYIGGKAAGILIARAIVRRDTTGGWERVLEPHDSFFVGSDLFHSYLVHNGWWQHFMEHKSEGGYLSGAARLRELIPTGSFPSAIAEEFRRMLEYFGQYPVIVRLSSLQEDSFDHAFAGKYGSYFSANQGTPEERYRQMEDAIRQAYASTMGDEALQYRSSRGLDRQEEQMALIIQRVAGRYHGDWFFPDIAGVAISYNIFAWDRNLDPHAGMVRMVHGLGTRATARIGVDYPRLVALDAPETVPFAGKGKGERFCQQWVDLLDMRENTLRTVPVRELADRSDPGFASPFLEGTQNGGHGRNVRRCQVSFDRFLADSGFAATMRRLLATLSGAYDHPVDVEFAGTFSPDGELFINLLQCRPLQSMGGATHQVEIPERLAGRTTLFCSRGNFLGRSVVQPLRRVVWVGAETFVTLPIPMRYELARCIGRLNRLTGNRYELPALIMAPGRLGTTTPEQGIPVSFAEICNFAAMAEVAFAAGSLMPELSFGSHFFQDLVESGIFYVALYPRTEGCRINTALIDELPNLLPELLPDDGHLAPVLRVVDLPDGFSLAADILSQRVACFSP